MGLRTRIGSMMFLMTVISIFITALIGFSYSVQREKQGIYRAMEREVDSLKEDIDHWLEQKSEVIEVLSQVIEKENMSKAEIKSLIHQIKEDADVSDIYMGFSDGDFISSVGWTPPKGYDPRQRPWYANLLFNQQVVFSEPYLDMTTKKYAISVGKRITNAKGEVIGVLAEDILLETLLKKNQSNGL